MSQGNRWTSINPATDAGDAFRSTLIEAAGVWAGNMAPVVRLLPLAFGGGSPCSTPSAFDAIGAKRRLACFPETLAFERWNGVTGATSVIAGLDRLSRDPECRYSARIRRMPSRAPISKRDPKGAPVSPIETALNRRRDV